MVTCSTTRTVATTLPSRLRETARRTIADTVTNGSRARTSTMSSESVAQRTWREVAGEAGRVVAVEASRDGVLAAEHESVAVVLDAQSGAVQPSVERVEHGRGDGDGLLDVEPGVAERERPIRRHPLARPNLL